MTFVVDGTNGLTFNDSTTQSSTATNASNISSGTLGKARLPTGSVLQVVNATYGTGSSTTSTTYVDTGLTASITPSSSTSKILVLVDIADAGKNGGTAPYAKFNIVRASTQIIEFSKQLGYTATITANYIGSVGTNYLDSPSTTSAITYKVQYAINGGGGTVEINASGGVSTITLMEIAA